MARNTRSRLRKSSKLMLRIDNQENNDIDAISLFKPNDSKSCSPVRLYQETDNNEELCSRPKIKADSIILTAVAIVGILGLLLIGAFVFKELM